MKTILLYSGGLDSTVARFVLKPEALLYVDLGVAYSQKEIEALPECVDIVSAKGLAQAINERSQHVPFRNMIFIQAAYNLGIQRWPQEDVIQVAVAGVKEDNTEDKNPRAFLVMQACLNSIRPKGAPLINVFSPFWEQTKPDLVRWMLKNVKEPQSELEKVVTCFSASGKRCGVCWACTAFWVALTLGGVEVTRWFDGDVVEAARGYLADKNWVSPIWADEIEKALSGGTYK